MQACLALMGAVLSASCWGRSCVCLSASRRLCLALPRSCSTGDAPCHMKLWDSDLDEAERQSLANTRASHVRH